MSRTILDLSPQESDAVYALVALQRESRVYNDEPKAVRALTEISRKDAEIPQEQTKKCNTRQLKEPSPGDSLLLTDGNGETVSTNKHSMPCLPSQELRNTLKESPSVERAEDIIRGIRHFKSDDLPGEHSIHSTQVQGSFHLHSSTEAKILRTVSELSSHQEDRFSNLHHGLPQN